MSVHQQINLYQDIFREQTVQVSARQVSLLVLLLIGVLALVSAGMYWQQQGLQEQLVAREQQKADLEEQLAVFRQQLQAEKGDQALQESVDALNRELSTKQRVLQALSGQRFGNSEGFVEQLSGLARQRIEGLWLTELVIRRGGTRLDMQGRSLKPEYVPNYLQKLSAEPIFAGTDFENLVIRRNEDHPGQLDFQLQSKTGRGDGK
ncbi:PilN domain-containing protein [Thiohalophilus thiocyanatoxydans]|uniref:MSHA biogenesis protein MshI n=1 Tax=Thiohalophilus thiocyanatoxydans TaxID=381308 RepID=A0A4R8ISP2_9GAMM|nr:PilN domain-containing protein [Thiohalophilus thiocyanatoxydans]TDY04071.1 hypothetical protein EDC23_0443 [Thiohalophilus thiocyanatoxydans]